MAKQSPAHHPHFNCDSHWPPNPTYTKTPRDGRDWGRGTGAPGVTLGATANWWAQQKCSFLGPAPTRIPNQRTTEGR